MNAEVKNSTPEIPTPTPGEHVASLDYLAHMLDSSRYGSATAWTGHSLANWPDYEHPFVSVRPADTGVGFYVRLYVPCGQMGEEDNLRIARRAEYVMTLEDARATAQRLADGYVAWFRAFREMNA